MNCPVCSTRSENIPNSVHCKSVRCPNCGDYDISGSPFDFGRFQRLGLDLRVAELEKAKQSPRRANRPIISAY
jgi:hypothetical protein